MRRFDPGPRLQTFLNKFNTFIRFKSVFPLSSTGVSFSHSIVVNRRKLGSIGEGGRTKTGPSLHHA